MSKKDYFFCYDKRLFSYLHDVKHIDYITIAISPKSKRTFALFESDNTELQIALKEYQKQKS